MDSDVIELDSIQSGLFDQSKILTKKESEPHIKTLSTIREYQIALIKFESVIHSLSSIKRLNNILRLKQSFDKLKLIIKFRRQSILKRIKNALMSPLYIHKRYCDKHLRRYLMRLRLIKDMMKYYDNKKLDKTYKKEFSMKDKGIAILEMNIKKKSSEISALKTAEQNIRSKIKKKEKAIKHTYIPKDSTEEIKRLQMKATQLETDNNLLREELNSTEDNVRNFLTDITNTFGSIKSKSKLYELTIELKSSLNSSSSRKKPQDLYMIDS